MTHDEPTSTNNSTWGLCHHCHKPILKGQGKHGGKWVERGGSEVRLHYRCMTDKERDYVADPAVMNARYAKTRAAYFKTVTRRKPPRKDPDLKMLGVWLGSDIHERVEKAMVKHGFTTKSTWLNMAVQEQLERDGC